MGTGTTPPVRETARTWAIAACTQAGTTAHPKDIEPVLAEIIERLLELAAFEPFPILPARRLGARLCADPCARIRMLALSTRTLLGFPAGPRGSLVATRWPLVASQAIDSYAQALQERALAEALAKQEQDLSAAVSQRVQEITALQHRLRHEATHDALTDLANRTLLRDRVRLMAGNPNRGVGLLVVDLDRFKQINDGYGHAVGDEVLVELAARLRKVCPPDAVVCRYGGDEFVLAVNSTHDVDELARRVVTVLNDPVWSTVGPVPVSASVGTACAPPGTPCDLENLLRRADQAMYAAKTAGGRRFVPAEDEEVPAVAG
ncbi:GGDEF domain-containing protein [Nocardia paucivorans]|uniref:GGDEF domain-containing protein n=1 Tax=Nocardia paucivorans TaxID=114259 RepID=UPI00031BC1CD|nr:GGDEF domain-containing protein [Nocardia paucivorans]